MKRCLSMLLAVLITVSLCACGGSSAGKWQEQYDLGIRYLSEGNYEEAIIAFEAAIKIDPKQVDAYIGLADVYIAQGDTEKAKDILNQALNAVGESAELSAALERLTGGVPDIPEFHQGFCDYEAESYIEPTAELEAVFAPIIAAGLADDQAQLREMLVSEDLLNSVSAMAKDVSVIEEDDYSHCVFWTKLGDALLYYKYLHNPGKHIFELEYRQISGTVFSCANEQEPTSNYWYYIHGASENYQWNGAFTKYRKVDHNDDGSVQEYVWQGTALNDLLNGEYTEHYISQNAKWDNESWSYEQYENGLPIPCWIDENGEPATTKIERKQVYLGGRDTTPSITTTYFNRSQSTPFCPTSIW